MPDRRDTSTAWTELDHADGTLPLRRERLRMFSSVAVLAPLAGGVVMFASGAQTDFPNAQAVCMLATVLGFAFLFLLVSFVPLSSRGLDRAEYVALAWAGLCLGVHTWFGPGSDTGRLTGPTLVIVLLFWRSTVIPGTWLHSLGGSLLLSVPSLLPHLGLRLPGMVDSPLISPKFDGVVLTVATATTIFLCAKISAVVYDLRSEVRRATSLGPFELDTVLGRGGMGEVYRARHRLLQRPTAIKVLRPDLAGERALARFEREVRLTAGLTHPSTIAVYDFGRTPDRRFYYAMELLDGLDLEELIRLRGAQPPARVVAILLQVAGSLAEAHDAGLLHRDVKAANVMLCRRGRRIDVVKVLDFGLAKEAAGPEVAGEERGTVAGTAGYLAPEGWAGMEHLDTRSDVYAVGVLAHVLLTGVPPFSGDSLAGYRVKHLTTPAPELPDEVPAALRSLVRRLLSKAPDERPGDGAELEAAVAALVPEVGSWSQADARGWWAREGIPAQELSAHRERTTGDGLDLSDTRTVHPDRTGLTPADEVDIPAPGR